MRIEIETSTLDPEQQTMLLAIIARGLSEPQSAINRAEVFLGVMDEARREREDEPPGR